MVTPTSLGSLQRRAPDCLSRKVLKVSVYVWISIATLLLSLTMHGVATTVPHWTKTTYEGRDTNLGLWKWCGRSNCIDVSEELKIDKALTNTCKDPFVQFYRFMSMITFFVWNTCYQFKKKIQIHSLSLLQLVQFLVSGLPCNPAYHICNALQENLTLHCTSSLFNFWYWYDVYWWIHRLYLLFQYKLNSTAQGHLQWSRFSQWFYHWWRIYFQHVTQN